MKNDKKGNVYYELRMSRMDSSGKVYSIRSLSKEIGINHARISELERGLKKPSLSELKAYQKYFHVEYNILLDGFTRERESLQGFMDDLLTRDTEKKHEFEKTTEVLFSSSLGLIFIQLLSEYLRDGKEEERNKLIVCLDMMTEQSNYQKATWQIRQLIDNTVKSEHFPQ